MLQSLVFKDHDKSKVLFLIPFNSIPVQLQHVPAGRGRGRRQSPRLAYVHAAGHLSGGGKRRQHRGDRSRRGRSRVRLVWLARASGHIAVDPAAEFEPWAAAAAAAPAAAAATTATTRVPCQR